jgi:hypothetical protein
MLIKRMSWDQKQRFNRTMHPGKSGWYIDTTPGSLSGVNYRGAKHADVMRAFDKCISGDKLRVV